MVLSKAPLSSELLLLWKLTYFFFFLVPFLLIFRLGTRTHLPPIKKGSQVSFLRTQNALD